MISMCKIHIYIVKVSDIRYVGGVGFLVNDTWAKWGFRYGHSFWSLFGNRMADLGLIDSKLGLYIKINVNNGQNKFEVHISKTVAKMAILWPKIGQRHFGARASHGHNLAIFHQILTNEHTKMTSSLRRIEWNQILPISLFYIGFLAPFLL